MEKVKEFLKRYWFNLICGLIIIRISISVIIDVINNEFDYENAIGAIVLTLFLMLISNSFNEKNGRYYWILKILGLGGIVLSFIGYANFTKNTNQNFLIGLFLISVFTYILGEIVLYLNKILVSIEDKNLKMNCPTCIGKGFVDLNDIKRLGKEDEWEQGYCRYCRGKGDVTKGITKKRNPLDLTDYPKNWE
jgi:hypothetical protein